MLCSCCDSGSRNAFILYIYYKLIISFCSAFSLHKITTSVVLLRKLSFFERVFQIKVCSFIDGNASSDQPVRANISFHGAIFFRNFKRNFRFILLLLFHFQCALVHFISSRSIFSKDRFLSQHFKHDQETKQYFRLGNTKQLITDKKINYLLR